MVIRRRKIWFNLTKGWVFRYTTVKILRSTFSSFSTTSTSPFYTDRGSRLTPLNLPLQHFLQFCRQTLRFHFFVDYRVFTGTPGWWPSCTSSTSSKSRSRPKKSPSTSWGRTPYGAWFGTRYTRRSSYTSTGSRPSSSRSLTASVSDVLSSSCPPSGRLLLRIVSVQYHFVEFP